MQRYDAVLVPGGGLRPGGALPPFVLDRLEAAQALAGEAPIIPLSAHTFHRPPPLDAAGFPVLEVNPRHPLLRRLADPAVAGEEAAETAGLLLDLARIQDGDGPRDPAGFARRVAAALALGPG